MPTGGSTRLKALSLSPLCPVSHVCQQAEAGWFSYFSGKCVATFQLMCGGRHQGQQKEGARSQEPQDPQVRAAQECRRVPE